MCECANFTNVYSLNVLGTKLNKLGTKLNEKYHGIKYVVVTHLIQSTMSLNKEWLESQIEFNFQMCDCAIMTTCEFYRYITLLTNKPHWKKNIVWQHRLVKATV